MNDLEATIVNQELLSHFDGYVCSDTRGLCVEAQGIMPTKSSGFSQSVMNCSKELTQSDSPIITIEGTNGVIMIMQKGDITIAATHKK
ncbi:hypothetical protein KM1_089470 [Entamoeba histolytica HM-3:IMSS]|uniref:Two tm domain ATPase n=3 Tax=Entamoeba TaxID=5758 RepID=A0A175JN42_ENTHI|nr:hypothetical protein KM1_089470 [Entamoeba histolytica HM-3:IMSS]GAT94886.1 two tm domain ATPase [Entamoeba histolytica]